VREPRDLRVDRPDDHVAVVTLDNPDKRNMMSEPMTRSWAATMEELAGDRDLRCVVVTGAGSAFCSGGDTAWIGGDSGAAVHELRTRMIAFYRSWLSIRRLEVPTIAAINGPAIGAGLCVALACDLRYSTPAAQMGVPFTRLGMHPGMAGTWLLPQVVGTSAARELLLTSRLVAGEEARALGLVNRVLPQEGFLDAVLEIAGEVASTAPVASRLTTLALRDGGHASFDAALQWEALAQPVTLATDDLQEGLRAARERDVPHFTGR